jgi:hypothetical protein
MNPPTSPGESSTTSFPNVPARRSSGRRRLVTAGYIILAAAFIAQAVRGFLRNDTVHEAIIVAPLDDPKELAARSRDAIGTYATGATPGERIILIEADGRVEFSEIGADPAIGRTVDSWQLARRGKMFCLPTPGSGVIDIINIDTLEYYGDTYRRTK